MRTRLSMLLVMALLAVVPAGAQETRGNINGTVQDPSGVIPGATVTITNVDTGTTQTLVTNASGYFEAPLLQAGPYRVTVDMAGFKGLTQSGITLSVGQSLTLKLTLEVGAISERIDVSATAPLLDTTSVSSGQNFDQALIAGLPMASNMPMLLARFAQGVVSPTTQVQVISGQIDGPTNAAGTVVGGVGGFNYTVDGATNAGSSRRIASSPNADMIEEMRVETSNFDAAQGHGTGGTIAMMTRAGSNSLRGTANYQYWTNKINSLNPQQKLAFSQRPETGKIYEGGYENYIATTLGGPVVIPQADRRPQQAVLLRQLPAQLRQRAGPEHADEHGPRQREAPQRRLLRPARAAERRPVPDLRSADGAAGPGASRQPDPHAVPEQHHPARSVHEPERHATRARCSRSTGTWPRSRTRISSSRDRCRPTTTTRAGFPTR